MHDRDHWARLLEEAKAERDSQSARICQLCVDFLGVTGAGISMVTAAGNRGVVYATDVVSAEIEALQFTLGEGPCVDAVNAAAPVLIEDISSPDLALERWPGFIEGAASAGVRAIFAFPLTIGAIRLGALDLWRDAPGALADFELSAALLAADAAALALLHLNTEDGNFLEQIRGHGDFHLQVHQATGMVQAQMAVSTQDALLLLRARAFADGRAVNAVASDVVERKLRFTKEDD